MSPASLTIGRLAPLTGSFYGYGTGVYGEGPYGVGSTTGAPGTMWGARLWNADGDIVAIEGFLNAPEVGDALALRQQILGYSENIDEEVIPVTWTADSTADGYYRVRKAAVNMKGSSLAHGLFEFSMQLERIRGYAAPLFESILLGADLTNAHSFTGATPWHAVPVAAVDYAEIDVLADFERAAEGGDMHFIHLTDYNVTPRFFVTPADYYLGAATFELGSGSLYRTIVGTQAENLPDAWRLSNGLVRLTPAASGRIEISHFNGTAWSAAKAFRFLTNGTHIFDEFTNVTVLRNSAEEAAIRLTASTTGGFAEGPKVIDIALRRGDRMVRGLLQSYSGRSFRVQRDTAEASSALTGGIRATANDADGDRFVLFSTKAHSTDLTNGYIQSTSGALTSFDFGIGSEVGGSGAAEPDRAGDLAKQYFAGQSEQMLVVSR